MSPDPVFGLIVVFTLLVMLSSAAAYYANRKGNSGTLIFILCILATPLVGWIVALLQPRNQFTDEPQSDTIACPFCAETIKREAIVCRFCNHDLRQPQPTAGADDNTCPDCGYHFPMTLRPGKSYRCPKCRSTLAVSEI